MMFASFGIRYCVDSSNHYTSCFKAAVICQLLAATSVYSVTTILLLLIMVLVVLIVLMLIRCQGCHSELHIVAEKGVTILYITSRKLCIVITAVAYHLTNILCSLSQSKLHFDKEPARCCCCCCCCIMPCVSSISRLIIPQLL